MQLSPLQQVSSCSEKPLLFPLAYIYLRYPTSMNRVSWHSYLDTSKTREACSFKLSFPLIIPISKNRTYPLAGEVNVHVHVRIQVYDVCMHHCTKHPSKTEYTYDTLRVSVASFLPSSPRSASLVSLFWLPVSLDQAKTLFVSIFLWKKSCQINDTTMYTLAR